MLPYTTLLQILGADKEYNDSLMKPAASTQNNAEGGFFGNPANKDIMAYILGNLGQKLSPDNPFAGMGQQLAQQNTYQRAMAPIRNRQDTMEKLLLGTLMGDVKMTPNGMQGLSGFSVQPGKDGGLPEYSIKGNFSSSQLGPLKSKLPFLDDSPSQVQPSESQLYQADPNLDWRGNMDRMANQNQLRELLTQVITPVANDPALGILTTEQQKSIDAARAAQQGSLQNIIKTGMSMEAQRQQAQAMRQKMLADAAEHKRKLEKDAVTEQRAAESHQMNMAAKRLGIDEALYNASQRGVNAAIKMQQLENAKAAGVSSTLLNQMRREQLAILSDPEVRKAAKDSKISAAVYSQIRASEAANKAKNAAIAAENKEDQKHYANQAALMEKWDVDALAKNPFEAHRMNKYGAYNVIFRTEDVGTPKAKAVPQTFEITNPKYAFLSSADKLYAFAAKELGKKQLSNKEFNAFVDELQDKKILKTVDYKSDDDGVFSSIIKYLSPPDTSTAMDEPVYPIADVDDTDIHKADADSNYYRLFSTYTDEEDE